MKTIVYVLLCISLLLFGCSDNKLPPEETTDPVPIQQPVIEEVKDEPTLSEEEIISLIWSVLPSKLPSEYNIKDFNYSERQAAYAGDGKWEFTVSGLHSDRALLPRQIQMVSDVKQSRISSEEITEYELLLEALFFQNTYVLEIVDIHTRKKPPYTNVLDQEEIYARILLINKWEQLYQNTFIFRGSIINDSDFALLNVLIEISYRLPSSGTRETVRKPLPDRYLLPNEQASYEFRIPCDECDENTTYNQSVASLPTFISEDGNLIDWDFDSSYFLR
ncbi:hypothetical protein ACFLYV_03920 [Chloroflexota bacterium]